MHAGSSSSTDAECVERGVGVTLARIEAEVADLASKILPLGATEQVEKLLCDFCVRREASNNAAENGAMTG